MGAIVMTALTILVLAASVVDSRDRVRRDVLTKDAVLREWYAARYGRRGRQFSRENLEYALQRAQGVRRWLPIALSACTMLAVVVLGVFAVAVNPELRALWRSPERMLDAIEPEVMVQTTIVLLLLPILIVEGILAALYVAEFDIGRLKRLLKSLD